MLGWRKHWRIWCALWKPNLPACFAQSCSSTRTGSTCGTALLPVFPSPTPTPSTAFASDRRRDHAAPRCIEENLLSSPTFSRIRSGNCIEKWPSPMGSAPAGPLPYLHIRARHWVHLPCITANRAVRVQLRPAPWKWATHLAGIATERKLAREERERLRQARADLAHVTRMTTMGELTASLAHEIKQPISAAVTDAKTCLRWLRRDDPDVAEAGEAASRLIKDVTRAADLISGINLMFKKGAPQRELVD